MVTRGTRNIILLAGIIFFALPFSFTYADFHDDFSDYKDYNDYADYIYDALDYSDYKDYTDYYYPDDFWDYSNYRDYGDYVYSITPTSSTSTTPDTSTSTTPDTSTSTSTPTSTSSTTPTTLTAPTPTPTPTLITSCDPNQGSECNTNACGTAGGTVNCDGTCSGSIPAPPYAVGDACTSAANNCGATNSGTIIDQCTGACSVSAPADVTGLDGACTSTANACGATNSGTYVCNAAGTGSTCSVSTPSNPPGCTRCNNINQCNEGYECSGSGICNVSAPSDAAISSFAADPSGNVANGTDVTYTVTASRDINVPSSLYYMKIYETGVTAYRNSCASGATCSYITNGINTSKSFVAKIETWTGSTVAATSDTVSTTWGVIDATAPDNVTNLSSSSHPNSTWKSGSTIDVSWTAATDNSGGSGLDGYDYEWSITSDTLPDGTKDIEENITTKTSPAFVDGNSYYFHIRSVDNAGNWATGAAHLGPFYIDATNPTSSFRDEVGADTPDGGSWQDANFTVYPADSDLGGSGLSTCYYGVYSDDGDPNTTNDWTVDSGTVRTCGSSFTITVGPSGDCRNAGDLKCQVQMYSTDAAGNTSATAMRAFSISFLTFPSNTWQRLWYYMPNNNFSTANYLGSNTISTLDRDWGVSQQMYDTSGTAFNVQTNGGINKIGFKASRTLTGLTPGSYTLSLGADDGIKLFVNDVNKTNNLLPVSAWDNNHSWKDNRHTVRVDLSGTTKIEIHYRENTDDAQLSFSYEALSVAPAPPGVNTDPSDTAIYVSWNSIGGISSATYRLEWCRKSVIDAGGSFSSADCGPPNSPTGGPPYFLTTTATSGYIIGTDVATAYNVRVRVDSGTSVSYVFPGNWASASATTRTPLSCNNVKPTNTASGSSVTDDCFKVERRCGPTDIGVGCAAACFFRDAYLSLGSNPITKIGTITKGIWKVTGSASYDLFAQGHGVECINSPDWRSFIYNVQASIDLKHPSPIDTASSSKDMNWALTGEGGQEFSLPSAATLTFDKVFNCPDASCDLWFYSSFSGNTWTRKQFFPGGSGDYVRQLAVMDTNFSWVRVDETPPGIPTINTLQDQWRKENPVTSMTVTDDIALSEIGYALQGKDCNFPADPCSEADWKKAQKSDLSGDLAPRGTSATTDWKMGNADWGRFDEGPNTLYLRVKDAAGNCRGCDDGTKIQFGVKKDTAAPGITVGEIKRTSSDPKVITNNWLKAGVYEISVTVTDKNPDNTDGSGVDTAYRPVTIRSKGSDDVWGTTESPGDDRVFSPSLVTYNKFDVWVGPPESSSNDCVDQGEPGRCRIFITARDLAGNDITTWVDLKIDYISPSAQ